VWKFRGYLKYSLVGVLGLGIHLLTLWLFTQYAHLWYIFSALIAIVVASLSNYILNYLWTFSDRKANKIMGYFKYLLSRLLVDGTYLGFLYLMTDYVGTYYLVSATIVQIVTAVLGYVIAVKWIWRRDKVTVPELSDEEMDDEQVY